MQYVKPKVFMLAETICSAPGLEAYLEHLGVPGWDTDAASEAEHLIEIAGRRCYRSFQTDDVKVSEQNPNLTKAREGNFAYIGNIIASRHGSVLEHASVTFALEDISRIVTHEFVRHRLCAFSQESLRFVRPTSLKMYFPEIFNDLPEEQITDEETLKYLAKHSHSGDSFWNCEPQERTVRAAMEMIFENVVTDLEAVQKLLVLLLGMDDVTKTFGDKKKLQSAMRRLLPEGMGTGLIVTANHRTWRHIVETRLDPAAEEEIRATVSGIWTHLATAYPGIYQDAYVADRVNDIPVIKFKNQKI
jgi:thymidylate synthase (FAD)